MVVLSPDYPRKRWCGLEWRWIRQLILNAEQNRIMLLQIGNPGDLTELGIVSGDGYLDISRRSAAEIAAAILSRLDQQQGSGGRLGLLEMPASGEATPAAQLARSQLEQGDQAFLFYTKLADASQLQRAVQAWQRASELDPGLADAQARQAFYNDLIGDLAAAEACWRQAHDLVADINSPQAQEIRNGLANVLAQQPNRRAEALAIYDGDRFYPRSALEAAMLRWGDPDALPQALDAIHESALGPLLVEDGPPPQPWGFKVDGALLLFESRAQQRCLLANVRAVTAYLAGHATSPGPAVPPLDCPDCQGVEASVRELLCFRLEQAQLSNPNAAASRAWLGCPR